MSGIPAGGGSKTPAETDGDLLAGPSHQTVANPSRSMDSLRVKLWREANRERYNARERERMRKKRAQKKALSGQDDSIRRKHNKWT